MLDVQSRWMLIGILTGNDLTHLACTRVYAGYDALRFPKANVNLRTPNCKDSFLLDASTLGLTAMEIILNPPRDQTEAQKGTNAAR